MPTLTVPLGSRSYPIEIGTPLRQGFAEFARRLAPKATTCFVVGDTNVEAHVQAVRTQLESVGFQAHTSLIPAGEGSKNLFTAAFQYDRLADMHADRSTPVVAVGGGVVGDLAGFVASTYNRGLPLLMVPTTLLAMVDSSVGGKVGINHPKGKNLIGAFYQPSLVLADTAVLDSLPIREFRAGYAEVAKYGLIDDAPFFHWLEQNWRDVFAGGAARQDAIRRSCAAKAAVVERDEFETGDRALLNLGHTFGHAFERLTRYDSSKLVHGEGVSVGMACAYRFSVKKGLCHGQDAGRMEAHLRQVGLPTRIRQINDKLPAHEKMSSDAILAAMFQDKKVERGALTFILARGIGQSFIAKNVPADEVKAFLDEDVVNVG